MYLGQSSHPNSKSNSSNDALLVAMRRDKDGISDKIIELLQTLEIGAAQTLMTGTLRLMEGLWDM
jgi:hypothetical protein